MKIAENSAHEVVVDAENPWPGLDYFAEQSQAFFHGREKESDLLLTMVRHRLLTVLYGQSGLGKSSLLQAGLFPRLRADRYLPVYIRLSHTNADGLGGTGATALVTQTLQFIRDAITEAIEKGQLLRPTNAQESAMPRDDESLWEYLHRRVSGLQGLKGERVSPVLVFDQFEEIFTLGRDETRQAIREAFLHDLADCVENRLPKDVLEEMNRQPRGDGNKFVNLEFIRQDYRILLSLREDYLAELHDLSDLMPSIHENETRLLPLNGWQALDAVSIPGEALLEPMVAREIVEIVAASRRGDTDEGDGAAPRTGNGEFIDESKLEVDPALLSMVCRELNIERQRRKESKITQQIADELLKTSGRSVLRRFYTDCFRSLPDSKSAPEVQKFVEDELLTPAGYRNMAELIRAQNRLAGSKVPNPAAAIQHLIDERLLRVSERRQDKTKWLELTHDVLCDVVKESRHERETHEAKEREERVERERAARRLEEAERQRTEAETQAREAREREEEALGRLKQMRRVRRFGIAALVLLICFAGALCFAGFLAFGRYQTGTAAEHRSRVLLERAKEKLSRLDEDRRNVYALRMLGRAVRTDPSNDEAAKLACQLLVDKNWCPPLSPPLHYSGSPLLCAGFSPDTREIVAIALDGNLIRWSADSYQQLASIPLVPDKTKSENKVILTSAGFSRDGKRILITLYPSGQENARILGWSDQEASYRPSQPKNVTVEFKETSRSFAWSRDGNLLFIFPMRVDQSICHIFRFEGNIFKETGTVPNTTAGDLSPDDQWFATASPGGRVQLWDANTLQGARPSPEPKKTFEPVEATPETRFFSLFFSDDGRELAGTAWREPARIWNTQSGTSRWLRPKSPQDQIMRIVFGPRVGGDRTFAAGMNGMVGLWDVEQLDQLRAEPMCLPDAFVYPTFSPDGNAVISLSGPVWGALDSVRVWDISLRRRATEESKPSFSGKAPPPWLPDLAEAVAGLRVAAEEEETGPAILSELRKKYAGSRFAKEYAPVWNRFLAKEVQ